MSEVTNPSAFQERSLAKQVLFFIITFGLYGAYWLYVTNKQLIEGTGSDSSPVVRFILCFFIIGIWFMADDSEAVTDQSGPVIFLLYLVFAPAAWYLVQDGINDVAAEA